MEHSNKLNDKYDWVKNLYFYLILAGTILALGISSFILIYSSAIRFVFTDLQQKPYISYEQCKNNVNYTYYPSVPFNGGGDVKAEISTPSEPQLTKQEQKDCADKQSSIEYQQTLLSTSLAILVAGIILTTHLYLFKFKKLAKTKERKESIDELKK